MSILHVGVHFLHAILLLPACAGAQVKYDLVIKGGEVIDPRYGIRAVRDVGIRDHKIAAIEKVSFRELVKQVNTLVTDRRVLASRLRDYGKVCIRRF